MKKITYVTNPLGRASGASKSGLDVLDALTQKDKVTLISYFDSGKAIKSSVKNHSYVTRKSVKREIKISSFSMKSLLKSLVFFILNTVSKQGVEIDSNSTDLFIANSFCIDIFSKCDLTKYQGLKVCVVRGSVASFEAEDSVFGVQEAAKYLQNFDKYIFVSKNIIADWCEVAQLSKADCHYIPNCCDEASVDRVLLQPKTFYREKLFSEVSPKAHIICCMGSVQYRKGQDVLVEAIKSISASNRIDTKIHVAIVGGDVNGFTGKLKELVRLAGLSDIFTFTGHVDNALEYLYASDSMVLPSRGEAMPRSVLEAMALQVPVITTNIDGMPELISHATDGMLVTPDDVSGLAESISTLLLNKSLAKLYGANAHNKYWSGFSKEAQMIRYGNLLETGFEKDAV